MQSETKQWELGKRVLEQWQGSLEEKTRALESSSTVHPDTRRRLLEELRRKVN